MVAQDSDAPRINWTEDRLEQRIGIAFLVGRATGWKDVSEMLLHRAGNLFAAGDDDKAKLLRELASELKKQGESISTEHKELQKRYNARWE